MIPLSRNIRDFPRSGFSRAESKVREVNFIYQSPFARPCFPPRKNEFTLRARKKLPRQRALILFFLATKEGRYPSKSPRRFRDSRTWRHPFIYTHPRTYVSYPRRFGTSAGAEKLSKTKLTWPARRTLPRVSCSFARAGCVSSTRS